MLGGHIYKIAVVVLLILGFPDLAMAQSDSNRIGEEDIHAKATYLSVGDKVPDVVYELLSKNVRKFPQSYFSDKPIVLDFWATWCTPCLAAFPKISSFQEKFEGVQFIAVTSDEKETVERLIGDLRLEQILKDIPVITNDSSLKSIFYHKIIPHYVWIDSTGIIRGITGTEDLIALNIQRLLECKNLIGSPKSDALIYNSNNVLIPEAGVLFNSRISNYNKDIRGGSYQRSNGIFCANHPVRLLYQIAFGEFRLEFMNNNRLVLLNFTESDSLRVGVYNSVSRSNWKEIREQNLYCYELKYTDSLFSRSEKFRIMQEDLNRFFKLEGITGKIEKRRVKTLVLIRTDRIDRLRSKQDVANSVINQHYLKIDNLPIAFFLIKLQASFYKDDALPIFDETNYKYPVSLEVKADLSNIEAVNSEIKKYGLKFVEKYKKVDMVVLHKLKQ